MELHSQRLDIPDLDLVRSSPESSGPDEFQSVLRKVCRSAAELLQVTRVGAWVRDPASTSLRRLHLHNRTTGRSDAGGTLSRERCPHYFQALEDADGILAVSDVYSDDRTRELSEVYAEPGGVRAWLDVPIPGDEEFAGVIRFEHVGPRRQWSEQERRVGRALGVLVARAWEQLSGGTHADLYSYAAEQPASRGLLDLLPAGVVLADASGVIVRCNEAFADMLGYDSPGALTGESIDEMYASKHDRRGLETRLREEEEVTCFQYEARTRTGATVWLLESAVLLRSGSRGPRQNEYVLSSVVDATAVKERETELERQAYRDPLTGLANRRLLWESAEQTLALAERHDREVAVAYLDLSAFKAVNDRYGHDVGDRVLKVAAERLVEGVRDSDLVARIGGDEFAILYAEVDGERGVREVGGRMLDVLGRPLRVDGHQIDIEANVGIALFPRHGRDADELLKRADAAMYRAKRTEDEHLRVYRPDEDGDSSPRPEPVQREPHREVDADETSERTERVARGADGHGGVGAGGPSVVGAAAAGDDAGELDVSESDLRTALAAGQFALHYQPIYRLPSCELAGAEALLRWQHPERGLLSAADFVPVIRDEDLVRALDQWSITTAVAHLRGEDGEPSLPWISVNVDPQSLRPLAFYLDALLKQEGVQPGRLIIEVVTESASSTIAQLSDTLTSIRQTGCRIALDLSTSVEKVSSYLQAYPADLVKLDLTYLEQRDRRSLTGAPGGGIQDRPDTEVLVKRVETEKQYERIRTGAVGLAQGFYCGRPVPPDRLLAT